MRAYNEANVAGVSATASIHVIPQPVLYVAASNPNPRAPYTSWATAATNIQDAVNAASFPRAAVLVTNGVYPGGVSVTNPLTLRSVNGPQFTIINGGGPCVSLAEGASLTGFTLRNGFIMGNGRGGGVYCASLNAFVTNCWIVGNQVGAPQARGGGAYGGTLYNCTLSGNKAWATQGLPGGVGGGACSCTLYNCIVYYNTAAAGANCADCTLIHCCTTPLPTGVGNISNDPLFVDSANGNLRLQSNSPCINAGNNEYVATTTDLDGRPRIVGGTVDIGAYEFEGPFNQWLQQYGLPTDGSADYADSDYDGLNNWQEWVCATNPTNRLSALRLLAPSITGTKVTVAWQSVAGVNYLLERNTNPAAPFTLLSTNILGQAGTTSYGDTNVAGNGPFFCRVGIPSP